MPASKPASDALILDAEGELTLSSEAARVLARIIRAHRDRAAGAGPQTEAAEVPNRRHAAGH